MLKQIPSLHKKIIYVLICLALVFAAIQTYMVFKLYEPDVFLYKSGAVLPGIFNVALAVFAAGVLVLFAFIKTESYPASIAKTSVLTRIFSLLCSAGLLACGIHSFSTYRKLSSDLLHMAQKQDNFIMWSIILSAVAFVYYILSALLPEKATKVKVWFGFTTIAWHILYLLSVYFDMSNPLNNPIRVINEFALVGIMMYLAMEMRFSVKIPQKGLYISIAIVAFTLLLSSSVPNIVYVISGKTPLDGSITIFIYQLFAAGYVLTRLISQLKSKE